MGFYNNVFASSYNFYAKFKREAPLGSSVCVIFVCQMTLLFFIIAILKKITDADLTWLHPYAYYCLPLFVLWLVILFRYYRKDRVQEILEEFNKKNTSAKRIWGILALASFIIPITLTAILLTK